MTSRFGACQLCGAAIEIPGADGYLCSSRVCGELIKIYDKKKKKVLSTHEPKGWVKYEALPRLLRKKEYRERRARGSFKVASSKDRATALK